MLKYVIKMVRKLMLNSIVYTDIKQFQLIIKVQGFSYVEEYLISKERRQAAKSFK